MRNNFDILYDSYTEMEYSDAKPVSERSALAQMQAEHGGKLVFHIMGALVEFECDLIRERTKAGMKVTQKHGKHVGRPKSLSSGRVQYMHELLDAGKTQAEVAALFGVSANTIGRQVREKMNTKTIVKNNK